MEGGVEGAGVAGSDVAQGEGVEELAEASAGEGVARVEGREDPAEEAEFQAGGQVRCSKAAGPQWSVEEGLRVAPGDSEGVGEGAVQQRLQVRDAGDVGWAGVVDKLSFKGAVQLLPRRKWFFF